MLTVKELADSYGVSSAFVLSAFEKMAYYRPGPEAEVPQGAAARFETRYGAMIRAGKPKPVDDPDEHLLYEQPLPSVRVPGQRSSVVAEREARASKPHVMRVAHAHHTTKRDGKTLERYRVLSENPGPDHAIDPEGTREGDPWRRGPGAGEYKIYEDSGPHAVCGARVTVLMGDRFDRQPDDPDVCPGCAEIVAAGNGFRTPYHERRSPWCDAYLNFRVGGVVNVEECARRSLHDGPHRTLDGAAWVKGIEDYVAAPTRALQ